MSSKAAIENLGGITKVARRYGYKIATVGSWSHRDEIPPHILLDDVRLSRALKRAGYVRGEKAPVSHDRRIGAEPGQVMLKRRASNGIEGQ